MPAFTEDAPPPPAVIPDHPAHHRGHKLKRVDGAFFICDGCGEHGAGTWYRCEHERCNFDLHTCCAVPKDTLTHPTFGDDRVFVFLLQPPAMDTTAEGINGGAKFRACVACGEDVRGFLYHCFGDEGGAGLDLHPCCASLPECALQLQDEKSLLHDEKKRRPPFARHRGWVGGTQANGTDGPSQENTRLDRRVVSDKRHLEASSSSHMSDSRTGGRERRAPAARHRSWSSWIWKP